jgi:hypothetical protein
MAAPGKSPRRFDSPRRVAHDAETAQRVLELVPCMPTAVWGIDTAHRSTCTSYGAPPDLVA